MKRCPPLTPAATMRWDAVRELFPRERSRVLEIGAGVGGFAARISERHTYLGYEPDLISFQAAHKRFLEYPDADIRREVVNSSTAVPGSFDVLVPFEVLEHVDDDVKMLSYWLRSVRPGGLMIISVPAHRSRFGCCDTLVGHRRRYDRRDLEMLLKSTGLTPEKLFTYGFPITRLTEWIRNALCEFRPPSESGTKASGRLFQPNRTIEGVIALLLWPFRLLQRPFFSTDLGTGWVVAARKSP